MILYELRAEVAPEAVEEIDGAIQAAELLGWNIVEDALAHTAALVAVFESEAEAWRAWEQLREACSALAAAEVQPALRQLAEPEWRESYRAHFRAWQFGRLHWAPIWEQDAFVLPEGHEVLWLDPGLAFGTGNHETTRLCVERLVELAARAAAGGESPRGLRVIDAGCGSGILALSAAKLGLGPVVGFDNDPEAVRVSEENAALNGLSGAVEFFVGDLVSGLAGRQAELVLANILAPVLIEFAAPLVAAVAPGGTLVLSGILTSEGKAVSEAFRRAAPDWHFAESHTLGEWCDITCTRPA
ncbi:ribosomal protein L11 methyltransferase [Cephaloticoccus primus]|uniref:Ribosomal protein L11 methyltransferase n=1 Tax=Cephaloticoccus primus TaxID=1548207 RepID=A0A139SRA7_9BACT|nr:50S ribosomal protein L11 methyltransferase [Cephaloticoccus primus]KXU37135.1 ribosomal protein L11 methyltransferase [Cephaloticoccus primus]